MHFSTSEVGLPHMKSLAGVRITFDIEWLSTRVGLFVSTSIAYTCFCCLQQSNGDVGRHGGITFTESASPCRSAATYYVIDWIDRSRGLCCGLMLLGFGNFLTSLDAHRGSRLPRVHERARNCVAS